jgi:hypothetical protein
MPLGPENTLHPDSVEGARTTVAPTSLPAPSASRVSLQATDLPLLVIDRANLPATARALAKHLTSPSNLFERGPHVVKIVHAPSGYRSEPLNVHSTVIEAHAVCRPVEERIVRGELIQEPITLPNRIAQLFLNLNDQRGLPTLQGICAAPLLTDDGSIRCESGYDRVTGVWCVGVDMPPLLERPTLEDAQESLRFIRSTFATFPFADAVRVASNVGSVVDLAKGPAVDETNFVVGLMTAVCRPSLPLAPALLIRAPQLSGSGTGKGLLVHAIAQIAFGQAPTAFTSSGSRQELGKRIESALIESGPIVFLDNCNAEQLRSNVLAQVITESAVTTRLLGQTKMVPLITNAFIALTGNAVRISEDLARRFLVVELDAKCENPEQRPFDEDFSDSIKEHRVDLLVAVLTIWRWGRQTSLKPGMPLGSFERWALWCRDPLLALGCVDPVQRAADIKSEDPLRQGIFEFLQAWHAHHGSKPIKLRDLDHMVSQLIHGSRQKLATLVRDLDGVRVGGFVMSISKSKSNWGAADYTVHRDHEMTAH